LITLPQGRNFQAKVTIGDDVATLGAQNYYGTNFTLGLVGATTPVTLLANAGQDISFISPDILRGGQAVNSLQMNAPGGITVQDANLVLSANLTGASENVPFNFTKTIIPGLAGDVAVSGPVVSGAATQLPSNVNVPDFVKYDSLVMRQPDSRLLNTRPLGLTGSVDVGVIKALDDCSDGSAESAECKIN
jgi:hypothetical protein